MRQLSLRNRQRACHLHLVYLRSLTQTYLEEWLGLTQYDVAITLLGAQAMGRVNWDHLRHEGPTDVITFPYSTPGAKLVQGEILICPQVARDQARQFRTDWRAEVVRYMVHGMLHLLGYDDTSTAARRIMKRQENRWMRRVAAEFDLRKLGTGPAL